MVESHVAVLEEAVTFQVFPATQQIEGVVQTLLTERPKRRLHDRLD